MAERPDPDKNIWSETSDSDDDVAIPTLRARATEACIVVGNLAAFVCKSAATSLRPGTRRQRPRL